MNEKNHSGNCRLCGQIKKLTKEHVPPRSCNNKQTIYVEVDFIEYIKSFHPYFKKKVGRNKQGGIAYYSLCRECNNFLGTTYVKEFKSFYFKLRKSIAESKNSGSDENYKLTLKDIKPLSLLKQIVSMILSINSTNFSESFNELRDFVLDKNSNSLPNKFRIYVYANTSKNTRYSPFQAYGTLSNGLTTMSSEISFPPFGFVLTIKDEINWPNFHEITYLKDYSSSEKIDLYLELKELNVHSYLGLDYRTENEVLLQMLKTEAQKKKFKDDIDK